MPRIRTIKPEFWDSPSTARASLRGRLFFIAMWNWADDYGRGTANAKALIGFAFPNDDDVTAADYPSLASEVSDCFGVAFYEVDGRPFFAIPTFDKHQRTEKKAKPAIPEPPREPQQTSGVGFSDTSDGQSDETVGTTALGSRNRGTGEREQGKKEVVVRDDATTNRDDVEALCEHLASKIEGNGATRPTVTERWRTSCRLMLDADHRTTDQVRAAIDWCQNDEFWRANILSMPKLRERYDQLSLQAQRQRPPNGGRRSTTEDRVTTALDISAQLAAEGR